jgi:hypothetical protein
MFAHLKFGGTNQVAHVFDHHQIEQSRIEQILELVDAPGHHPRIQVVRSPGVDRHHWHAALPQPISIQLCGHVPFNHGMLAVVVCAGLVGVQQVHFQRGVKGLVHGIHSQGLEQRTWMRR